MATKLIAELSLDFPSLSSYDDLLPMSADAKARKDSVILTAKDFEILSLVYHYDGLTTDLILKSTYPSPSSHSYGYSRIARLSKSDFLHQTRLPSITGVGSGQSFYTLGREGRKALASLWDVPRVSLLRSDVPSSLFFIAHHLQTCETRLTITQATLRPNSPAKLKCWITERELRAQTSKVPIDDGQGKKLIPDAYFVLNTETGEEAGFCVETDMGTVSSRRWMEKILLYSLSAFPAVLITVPHSKRKEELLALVMEQAREQRLDPTRFWFAVNEEIRKETILNEPVWSIAGLGASILLPTALNNGLVKPSNGPKTAAYNMTKAEYHSALEKGTDV